MYGLFNYVTGVSGLLLRTSSSSLYLGDYYIYIKNKYLPQELKIDCKKPNKNEIFGNLIFNIFSFLYSYYYDYQYFAFYTYFYVSILYFLYLNMFLFASKYKNYMILFNIIISGFAFFIFKECSIFLIIFLLFLFCFLIIFDNLISYKNVLEDEISYIDIHMTFFDSMVSLCFLLYSYSEKLLSFFLCNFLLLICNYIGIITYFYGEKRIDKNSKYIVFLKKILFVKNDKNKKLLLLETDIINENSINSNNINNHNNI